MASDVHSDGQNKDDIYAQERDRIEGFKFDDSVASAFDDMIRRSVPGYAMTLSLMSLIAEKHVQADSKIYDLGCSLGAGIVALSKGFEPKAAQFIGVDNSSAMLSRCDENLKKLIPDHACELVCDDISNINISNASIVVLNFTLQFIPMDQRLTLLQKIHHGLNAGGILLLSEKIVFDQRRIQNELTDLHHDFKRQQGYSDLEISQKRTSLENVLVPESADTHRERLSEAGFAHREKWLQCFNFASFIAIKS